MGTTPINKIEIQLLNLIKSPLSGALNINTWHLKAFQNSCTLNLKRNITASSNYSQVNTNKNDPLLLAGRLLYGTEKGTRTPTAFRPLPPQGSVSTNSTTSAKLLYIYSRYITCIDFNRGCFDLRNIFKRRLRLNLYF